jgi:hypothetical protein
VDDLRLQRSDVPIDGHAMRVAILPDRGMFAMQEHDARRIKRRAQRLAVDGVLERAAIGAHARRWLERAQLVDECGRNEVIGVEQQDPRRARLLQSVVALSGQRVELALKHPHVREALCDLDRSVHGEAVDEHDVVRPRQLRERPFEVPLLVAREDQRRDVREIHTPAPSPRPRASS